MSAEKIDDDEVRRAFDCIFANWQREIGVLAARSSLCFVVQAALIAFVAKPMLELPANAAVGDKILPLLLALVAFTLAFLSLRVINGTQFWISYWQERLQ